MSPAESTVTAEAPAHPAGQVRPQPRQAWRQAYFILVALAALGVYWTSSFALQARNANRNFGSDAHLYVPLAQGQVFDRVVRFHPLTVVMAVGWLDVFGALAPSVPPRHILKAMFAAVGAVGLWAAMWAFASVVPRGCVTLWGVAYAASLGVWYFASIEESKIVTATLSALYIAGYLRLREQWTRRGAIVLTAILMLACLNEIVAAFLIVIPIVDTLVQRGWDWRQGRWIAAHGLAAAVAFIILEGLINDRLVAAGPDEEGKSHLAMFIFYVLRSDHGVASLYAFLLNWLLFSIAAPTPLASYGTPAAYGGTFEPAIMSYLASPASAGAIALLGVIVGVSVLRRYRVGRSGADSGIFRALIAYALVRGVFFFVFNPAEPLLFSPAVTLAHLLVISIPFAASRFPAKPALLAAFAGLLLLANGTFVFG